MKYDRISLALALVSLSIALALVGVLYSSSELAGGLIVAAFAPPMLLLAALIAAFGVVFGLAASQVPPRTSRSCILPLALSSLLAAAEVAIALLIWGQLGGWG